MAHPTPRADALRQMREAKFEAEQRRLKQEMAKPAESPKPAAKARPAKATSDAQAIDVPVAADDVDAVAPAAIPPVKKAAATKKTPAKAAAKKTAAPKKAKK